MGEQKPQGHVTPLFQHVGITASRDRKSAAKRGAVTLARANYMLDTYCTLRIGIGNNNLNNSDVSNSNVSDSNVCNSS